MAHYTQEQKNAMWSQERRNFMARVRNLRMAGVSVNVEIHKPEKIQMAHIAALQSINRARLLKGVENKLVTVSTYIPDNVARDKVGKIAATKEARQKYKDYQKCRKKWLSMPEPTIEEIIAQEEAYRQADLKAKAEREEFEQRLDDLKQAAEDNYSGESLEEYYDREGIPENQRHLLHDIYSDETIFKEQQLREKYGDFYSELVAMLWRQKKTEIMSPEMIEYARQMAREKEELVEQITDEKEQYHKDQAELKRWRQHQSGEVPDEDNTVYDYGTLYIDYENGVKYSVDSNGEVTSEPLTSGQQPITYYRDVNTGTIYSSEDSRIYMRNSQGRLKYDAKGNPLIKPSLAMINEQAMDREEYEALIMELMRSKYENISTEVGAIVLSRMDEWQKKYSADEIRTAKEAAAADGYDISWSDIYEGDEERLALQLDVIESYLPNNNFFDRQAAIMKLAQYDDENENYEEPE